MKKPLNTKLTLLLLALAIMLSCHEEPAVEEDHIFTGNGFTLHNGLLKFDTDATLKQTLGNLLSMQNDLDAWEEKLPHFTSMRTAFNNLTEKDQETIGNAKSAEGFKHLVTLVGEGDEKEARMNIDDLVLATLVNHEGMIQVGPDVYKVDYFKLYKTNEANKDNLSRAGTSASREALSELGIEVYDVVHNYATIDAGGKIAADRTCDKRYWKKDRKRLKGEQWTTAIGPFYSGAGARTKHQKKVLGIWWRNKTNQLRLRANGSYIQYLNGIPSPVIPVNEDSGWQSDDGREAYTFEFCVNVQCTFQIVNLTSIHECTCDDNNYLRCDIVY